MATTMSTPASNTIATDKNATWRLTSNVEGSKTLLRIFVGDEQKSRFTAVRLAGISVLQVKPTKVQFTSMTEWAAAAVKSVGLSTDNPDATAAIEAAVAAAAAQPVAPAMTDAKRLHRLARKYGTNPSQISKMSQNALQIFWHQWHIKNDKQSATTNQVVVKNMTEYREKWVAGLKERLARNPVEFYSINRSPIFWKDGATMRQIGLVFLPVEKEGGLPGKIPYEHKIVNERGVVGTMLAELGIPADAELYVMKVERIVKQTLVKAE